MMTRSVSLDLEPGVTLARLDQLVRVARAAGSPESAEVIRTEYRAEMSPAAYSVLRLTVQWPVEDEPERAEP